MPTVRQLGHGSRQRQGLDMFESRWAHDFCSRQFVPPGIIATFSWATRLPHSVMGLPRRDSEGRELKSPRLRRRPGQEALGQGARSVRLALPSVPCARSHSTPGPVAVDFEVVRESKAAFVTRPPTPRQAGRWLARFQCPSGCSLRARNRHSAARWRRTPIRCPFGHCLMHVYDSLRSHAPRLAAGDVGLAFDNHPLRAGHSAVPAPQSQAPQGQTIQALAVTLHWYSCRGH